MATNEKDKITFEIVEHLGVISTSNTGWTKELNLVAWNGGSGKFDLRDWDQTHEHMSKGVTLHKDEAKKLYEILKEQKL